MTYNYPNFKKHFNTNPKMWIKFGWFFAELYYFYLLYVVLITPPKYVANWTFFICLQLLILAIFGLSYNKQLTLVNAKIGKHLKKRGYTDVANVLKEIDDEMISPEYAILRKCTHGYANFMITKNWIIGADGLKLMGVNAVRKCEVHSLKKDFIIKRSKYGKNYYFTLNITDTSGFSYTFFTLHEKEQQETYYIIKNSMRNSKKQQIVKKKK